MSKGPFEYAGGSSTPTPGSIPVADLGFLASPRLAGRTTAGAGDGEEISVDSTLELATLVLRRAALTGDVTAAAGSNATAIGANKVTNAMLAQGAARTVVGVAGNATANRGDIAGGGAATFLRDSGTALAFSALASGDFPANTTPLTALANAAAQYDIIGRKTASGGAWEDCTATQLKLPQLDAANVFTNTAGALQVVLNGGVNPSASVATLFGGFNGTVSNPLRAVMGIATAAFVWEVNRCNNTQASPTALASGDIISVIPQARGYDGSAYSISQAGVATRTINAWSGSDHSCEIVLFSTPGGSTTQVESLLVGDGVKVGTPTGGYLGFGTLNAAGVIRCGQFTFATLPAAATVGAGARAYITDSAAAPVFGVAAVGGGALGIPVTSDGTTWRNG